MTRASPSNGSEIKRSRTAWSCRAELAVLKFDIPLFSTRSGNSRFPFISVDPRGTFGTPAANFPFTGDRISLSALSSN